MAIVEEDVEPGPGAAIAIIVVIVLIVGLSILFYGLVSLHWFGFNSLASVGASPTVPLSPASVSPSASP